MRRDFLQTFFSFPPSIIDDTVQSFNEEFIYYVSSDCLKHLLGSNPSIIHIFLMVFASNTDNNRNKYYFREAEPLKKLIYVFQCELRS